MRDTWRAPRSLAAVLLAGLMTAGCGRSSSGQAGVDEPPAAPLLSVTTFGDSNTDNAWGVGQLARSYVSDQPPRPSAAMSNHPQQLAGLIEARWRAQSRARIRVVNHGIAGTTTGGGGHGGADRNGHGAPNARSEANGLTRFEGEVLGLGYPWSGGEPVGDAYPSGGIPRANAYVPGPNDFAYVSLGTNDLADAKMPPAQTIENLRWMVERWIATGHAADHIVLTTLAPRTDRPMGDAFPTLNTGIRALAAETGAGLIDLAAHTSPDDGLTWRSASMHVGDGIHYTTAVRAWIAEQMVAYITPKVVPAP